VPDANRSPIVITPMVDPTPSTDEPAAEPHSQSSAPGPAATDQPRQHFERPFVWLAILVAGVVVAVSLSFVAEKTDVSGTPGDVGHYCQQVAVIKRTSPQALGDGAPGNVDQAGTFVGELSSLERVAPDNMRGDVGEVLLAARDVYAALQVADPTDQASAHALALTVQRAQSRSEDAIDQMKEYTQEACGVDLSPSSVTTTTAVPTTTTAAPTTTPPTSH
jgi:hypothetical protein